jgi:hypothetical protein
MMGQLAVRAPLTKKIRTRYLTSHISPRLKRSPCLGAVNFRQ